MAIEDLRKPNGSRDSDNSVSRESTQHPILQEFQHVKLEDEIILEHAETEDRKSRIVWLKNMVTAYRDELKPHQLSHLLNELIHLQGARGKIKKIDPNLPDSPQNRYLSLKSTIGSAESGEHLSIARTYGRKGPDIVVSIHTPIKKESPTDSEQILSEYISIDTANPSKPSHILREVRDVNQDIDATFRSTNETDILTRLNLVGDTDLKPEEHGMYAAKILAMFDKNHPKDRESIS